MNIETVTALTTVVNSQEAVLTVRHRTSYVHTFHLKVGCVDEWLTIDDIKELRALCTAGLRIAAKAHK